MTYKINEIKLKPCPFCGGAAAFERLGSPRQSCIVSCNDCACRLEANENWGFGSAWNTRALTDQPEAPAQVETVTLYGHEGSYYDAPPEINDTHRLTLPADMKPRVYTAPDGAQVIVERIDDER